MKLRAAGRTRTASAALLGREPLGEADIVTEAVLGASRLLVDISTRSLEEVDDRVTPPKFRALAALAAAGPLRLTHLAEQLVVNPSTAMRMAERLHALGMIHRAPNPENRRESILAVTDAGRRVVDQVAVKRRTAIEAIVGRMTDEQRDCLLEALDALSTAAGEPPKDRAPFVRSRRA